MACDDSTELSIVVGIRAEIEVSAEGTFANTRAVVSPDGGGSTVVLTGEFLDIAQDIVFVLRVGGTDIEEKLG